MTDLHPNPPPALATPGATAEIELLAFRVGEQEYCVDIMSVREIRGWTRATPLPFAPGHVKGVINLRGTIVPVIDLRLKLRLAEARYDSFTVMIVLNVDERVVGIVVDSVSDVVPLAEDQVRATPEFGAAVDTRFIAGIGTLDEKMLILLDIETLLDSADMGQQAAVEDAAA